VGVGPELIEVGGIGKGTKRITAAAIGLLPGGKYEGNGIAG